MGNPQGENKIMTYTGQPTQPERTPKKAVVFTGRVSQDIELKETNYGVVTNINIAIDQLSGETQWGQATFWGGNAQLVNDFVKKGDVLTASGLMYNRTFTRNDGTQGSSLQFDNCEILLNGTQVVALINRITAPKSEENLPTQPQAPTQPEEPMIQIDDNSLPF